MRSMRIKLYFIGILVFLTVVSHCFVIQGSRSNSYLHHPSTSNPQCLGRVRAPSPAIASNGDKVRMQSFYGRGDEIWPPTNVQGRVRLEDNFPGGKLPLIEGLQDQQRAAVAASSPSKIWKPSFRRIPQLLRRAADVSQRRNSRTEPSYVQMMSTFSALGLILTFVGYTTVLDWLAFFIVSGYLSVLVVWAQSTRNDNTLAPNIPALPPSGHVPRLYREPLLYRFSQSKTYERWLKLGKWLTLIIPVVLLGASRSSRVNMDPWCGRLLFMTCGQVLTENRSRHSFWPLPLRIYASVLYSILRLVYSIQWALTSPPIETGSIFLAGATCLYLCIQTLVVLPWAVLRYMRAHFFAVEAAEVQIRPGLESTI